MAQLYNGLEFHRKGSDFLIKENDINRISSMSLVGVSLFTHKMRYNPLYSKLPLTPLTRKIQLMSMLLHNFRVVSNFGRIYVKGVGAIFLPPKEK